MNAKQFILRFLLTSALFGITTLPAAEEQKPIFDHFTTGFELRGAHARASCTSCHAGGVFEGTPTACASCHSRSGLVAATAQPSQHVLTTNQCRACHQPQAWMPVLRVDHLEVIGACSSCHNNMQALGKPADHLPTSDSCDSCHNTRAFSFARFSHAGITAGCFSCHNGVQALGKPLDHIPASNQCEACHNTVTFAGALQR